MNIYDDDLKFDPDKASAELRAQGGMTNNDAARRALAEIQTAALIDIADSLRTLAVESAIAMNDRGVFGTLPEGLEDTSAPMDTFAILSADAGTPVRSTIGDEDDDWEVGVLDGTSGVTEDEAWAGVIWEGRDDVARVWASQLEVIGSVTTLDGVEHVGVLPAASVDEGFADRLHDEIETPGNAFETADDALTELKAREKAAKKKGGKR